LTFVSQLPVIGASRSGSLIPALSLLLGSTVLLAFLSVRPADGAPTVGAVFPPWLDRSAVLTRIARAGLPIVRDGGLTSVMVVARQGQSLDSVRQQLGAWFLVDPAMAGACFRLTGPAPGRGL